MPLQQTLERIQHDIDTGNLSKARDRLHGLISTYPDNLELRSMLAEIYWKLQQPDMAGRYWYLEEKKTDDMQKACNCFEKAFNDDPYALLCAIKFKGDLDKHKDSFAGNKVLQLNEQTEGQKKWLEKKYMPRFSKPIDTRADSKATRSQKIVNFILASIVVLVILFSCIGVFSVLKMILGF